MESLNNTDTAAEVTRAEKLDQAKKVAVILKDDPSFDEMVSCLALGNFLETNGKQPTLICNKIPEHLKSIEGVVAKVSGSFGTPTLIISFDYIEGDIEKISYKVEGDKFNLIVNSKKGIDPSNLQFKSKATEFDLFIFLGVAEGTGSDFLTRFSGLGAKSDVEDKSLYFNKNGESISEQLVSFFVESNYKVDSKAAEWLFSGIKSAMSNFADPQSATAFEAAAQCVRWIKNLPAGKETPESWLSPKIYKGSTAVD